MAKLDAPVVMFREVAAAHPKGAQMRNGFVELLYCRAIALDPTFEQMVGQALMPANWL